MAAAETDQNVAVNKIATDLEAPGAVTPTGRPQVAVECASNPDLALAEAVAAAGELSLAPSEGVGGAGDLQDAVPDEPEEREELIAVAERATEAVLSYHYRSLDADRDAATEFMTDAYARELHRHIRHRIQGS